MSKVSMVKGTLNLLQRVSGVEAEAVSRIKPSQCGYSRLKGIFTSGQNYQNYDRIISTAERKVVGNIPKELVDIIVKNHPERKGELIKEVQSAFGQTAENLRLCQIAEIDAVKSLSNFDVVRQLFGAQKIPKNKDFTDIINYSAEQLQKSLSRILPKGSKIKIAYAGNGLRGHVFKIGIQEASGRNVILDRAIKVFKDQGLEEELQLALLKRFKNAAPEINDKDIMQIIKDEKIPILSELSDELLLKTVNEIKTNLMDDLIELNQWVKCISPNLHGANAEANSAMRLKHILGHNMDRTNAVNPDMFDLEHKFSIVRFSDSALPSVTSEINFDTLGIKCFDLQHQNLVNNRIVDFGGFNLIEPRLADKTILKYFKKIMNRNNPKERAALIQRYKTMAQNPNTPLRDKITEAVKMAEERAA